MKQEKKKKENNKCLFQRHATKQDALFGSHTGIIMLKSNCYTNFTAQESFFKKLVFSVMMCACHVIKKIVV